VSTCHAQQGGVFCSLNEPTESDTPSIVPTGSQHARAQEAGGIYERQEEGMTRVHKARQR